MPEKFAFVRAHYRDPLIQELVPGGPTGIQTEFGPGDQGYVGGRWWMDTNGNGEMDAEDAFFLCPLLGPGFDPHA